MTAAIERLAAALRARYRIERELGAGGMATVYLAQDIRHDRRVALKVLRPELAAVIGAERFLHEIKTTANLQHPHIVPLLDSGEADGLVYYVMPFVEGESLRDRLTREHQLPIDDAVRIAREAADALDYAHRHGVVHRDIKPENILLHDGRVQIADFGIALAVSAATGGTRLTETGMSLGTPHYMAPEQAMGERHLTPRVDVYALGCVLYEMLAGEPPFTGPTAQAIVARVMTDEPRALTLQRHTITPELDLVVRKALEKLPADRFGSAAELGKALADPASAPAGTRLTRAAAPAPTLRERLAWPLAGLAAVATIVAAWALLRPRPAAPRPVSRYVLTLPDSQAPLLGPQISLAPDGSRLAYFGGSGRSLQLWVKERNRLDATPVAQVAEPGGIAFSPDGRWVAFALGNRLDKVSVTGGAVTMIADSVSAFLPGLAWLDDGTILYTRVVTLTPTVAVRELARVSSAGGTVTTAWRSDSLSAGAVAPLPGSRGVLFTACVPGNCDRVQALWVLDLRTGRARRLIEGATIGYYVPTGHIVFGRNDGAVLAVPFDPGSLEVRGEPVPVLQGVTVAYTRPLFSVASDGTLLARLGAGEAGSPRYEMVWVDRTGRETVVDSSWVVHHARRGGNAGWALSPDGTRLAIGLNTATGDDIWIKRLPRGPLARVSFDTVTEFRPRWTADGRAVSYGTFEGGNWVRRSADGTGAAEVVLDLALGIFEGVWSADGQWLVVRTGGTLNAVGGRDIYGIRTGIDSAPVPLVVTETFDESAIALSPDGRWLAYQSNETGRPEVFVRPFPRTESGKEQVSSGGGAAPLWARNGRELFYVNGNRQMVSVPVAPGSGLRLGEPRVLFTLREALYLGPYENYTPFDVSPDGSRFIMARRIQTEVERVAPLVAVENWLEELRALTGRR